jgi:hypothetical protein
MSSSKLIRWGGLAAILASLMYVVEVTIDLLTPGQPDGHLATDYVYEAAWGAAFALLVLTLLALRALHKGTYGRLGTTAFFVTVIGHGLMVIKSSSIVMTGVLSGFQAVQEAHWFWDAIFLPAIVLSIVGTVLLGIATLRANVLPRWLGAALIILWPLAVLFVENGPFVNAIVWMVAGYVLWSRTRAATPEPQPTAIW